MVSPHCEETIHLLGVGWDGHSMAGHSQGTRGNPCIHSPISVALGCCGIRLQSLTRALGQGLYGGKGTWWSPKRGESQDMTCPWRGQRLKAAAVWEPARG